MYKIYYENFYFNVELKERNAARLQRNEREAREIFFLVRVRLIFDASGKVHIAA